MIFFYIHSILFIIFIILSFQFLSLHWARFWYLILNKSWIALWRHFIKFTLLFFFLREFFFWWECSNSLWSKQEGSLAGVYNSLSRKQHFSWVIFGCMLPLSLSLSPSLCCKAWFDSRLCDVVFFFLTQCGNIRWLLWKPFTSG